MIKLYLLIYNVIFAASLPFIVLIVLFSPKNRKDFLYKLAERFAVYKFSKIGEKKVLWTHCASLGEVRAVEPVLDELKNRYLIVLTSTTKSGREYAQKSQKADFTALLALDIYPFMHKAFNAFKPDMLMLVETELWPTMLYIASRKGVKVATINGRISDKSFKVYKKLRIFWTEFIGLINIVIARSGEDADRFAFLSGRKNEIAVSGNIKYDRDFTLSAKREEFFLSDEEFIFTAGSTREGEEEIIANVYAKVSTTFGSVRFFLAPRHISRIAEVSKILVRKNIEYSLFSVGNFKSKFILIDVFGKLQSVYSVSDVCYIGGSIVDKGGQNPIEPAICGKPILFGKNMSNFKAEAEILVKFGGAFIVEGVSDFADKIKSFIADKNFIKSTGKKSLKAIRSQQGAVVFTVKKIEENLNA